jgi:hypothetical protein
VNKCSAQTYVELPYIPHTNTQSISTTSVDWIKLLWESTDTTVPPILYLCVTPESMKKQTGIQFRDKWACTIYSNIGFYYPNDAT